MPHTTPLAFESPMILSIVALLSGGIWLMLWTRTHTAYMLALISGWWLLCAYWGLLAVSAGPAPVISRADIALLVRATGVAAALALGAGKAVMLWRWWCVGRRCGRV